MWKCCVCVCPTIVVMAPFEVPRFVLFSHVVVQVDTVCAAFVVFGFSLSFFFFFFFLLQRSKFCFY